MDRHLAQEGIGGGGPVVRRMGVVFAEWVPSRFESRRYGPVSGPPARWRERRVGQLVASTPMGPSGLTGRPES